MRRGSLLVLAIAVVLTVSVSSMETLDVYFINVGHGDAILVKHGTTEWLIDTGYENNWPDTTDCEELFPVPVDPPIEYAVLSHGDQDHYSAFDRVFCACGITKLFSTSDQDSLTALGQELQEAGNQEGCLSLPEKVEELASDDESVPLTIPGVVWRVLHPSSTYTSSSDNNQSLVLLLSYGSVHFLFPGDIQTPIERILADSPRLDGTVILKVAHHGSHTSTSAPFLEWADPELAIVSGDEDDLHVITREALGEHGVPFLQTSDNGTICVSTDGTAFWVRTSGFPGQDIDCPDD